MTVIFAFCANVLVAIAKSVVALLTGSASMVAEVDLVGNDPEEEVARQMRRIERELEGHDSIETAVLSLSVSDEASLAF